MQPKLKQPLKLLFLSSFLNLLLFGNQILPVNAAERLVFKVGIFEQSIEVDDLEEFANKGKITNSLKPYSFLLTPEIQEVLGRKIQLDPDLVDEFVDNFFKKSGGDLLEKFGLAFPESSLDQVKSALKLALRQTNEINAISLLKAYPQETVTIDLTSALGFLLQLNSANLQSQILSPILEEDLKSATNPEVKYAFDPTQPGEEKVLQSSYIFTDSKRNRTIISDIYYSNNSSNNLILMSHGFASDRKFLKYLAYHLASYGLTVVSLEHPGSNVEVFTNPANSSNPNPLISASEFIDRPQDVSFVLDELTKINQTDPNLQHKLNTDQVTFIGHSFGGYTGLVLGGGILKPQELNNFCQNLGMIERSPADWLQCSAKDLSENNIQLQDRRIKQIIALNPLVGKLFGEDGLKNIKIPVLILSSSKDAITPSVENQLRPFQQLPENKYLLVAVNATHLTVTDRDVFNSSKANNTLVNEVLGKEADPLKKLIKAVSLAFIFQETNQANNYQPFLTPSYVESLSSQPLIFRLTRQLPQNLAIWLQ